MLKNIQEWILLFIIIGFISLFGNWLGYGIMPLKAIPGMGILVLVTLIGLILHKLIPLNVPSIAYISIVGILVSMPWTPGSHYIVLWTSEVELLSLATPVIAYLGISVGRSWNDFKKIGWKTFVVGTFVIFGSFIGSAIIAEVILRIQGII